MNVIFESDMPVASLKREAVDFFTGLHGLVIRESNGVLAFSTRSGAEWVRLEVVPGDGGRSRVTADTQELGALVQDFQKRVAPDESGQHREARMAAGDDLERHRQQAERQEPPPDSAQSSSPGTGGGPLRG